MARRPERVKVTMWWQDLLWGFWNGLISWPILIAHIFGAWARFPLFDVARNGNWYSFGFLLGAGSLFLGTFGARRRNRARN